MLTVMLSLVAKDQMALKRLPAEDCASCGRRLEMVGGRRIAIGGGTGVEVVHRNRFTPNGTDLRLIQLQGRYDSMYLVLHGTRWKEAAVRRAVDQAQASLRPWVCQVCARKTCACGAPSCLTPGCGLLDDTGHVAHQGYFIAGIAGGVYCTDPSCNRYRAWGGGKAAGKNL